MGQMFRLHLYLINSENQQIKDYPLEADISSWMPANSHDSATPDNRIVATIDLPNELPPGEYEVKISMIDERTGKPINLAFSNPDSIGRYYLTEITASSNGGQ
jgi:hypothetical protein